MSDSFTKSLGSAVKWTGKYSLLFLIIALIMTAVTISFADPSFNDYYVQPNKPATIRFEVQESNKYLININTHDFSNQVRLELQQLTFVSSSNETSNFQQHPDDQVIRSSIFAGDISTISKIFDLNKGTYEIVISSATEDIGVFGGYAKFNIQLLAFNAILFLIFAIFFVSFNLIWPFWIVSLAVNLATPSSGEEFNPDLAQATPRRDQQVERSREVQSNEPQETSQESPQNIEVQPPIGHYQTSSDRVKRGSSLGRIHREGIIGKITQRDWALLAVALVFFVIYLTNPFSNGFLFFLALIIATYVGYSVIEREKLKDRLSILLKTYPKASIAFLAEQLDKDEDQIIGALRLMILDEGFPIRLDLVNRRVSKVGLFHDEVDEEELRTTGTPTQPITTERPAEETTQQRGESAVDTDNIIEEQEETDNRIIRGQQGLINEPWAYCQACGEGLKKKVKYCYVCGARQYD